MIGFMIDNGYKCVTLSSSVFAEDKSAEKSAEAVLDTFKEGRKLLELWRQKTAVMYPNQPDLVDEIPHPSELNISKLHKGSVMTDNCDKAHKERRILAQAIREAAQEKGIAKSEIKVFQLDCWHHLRNTWFDNVMKDTASTMQEIVDEQTDIPSNVRIHTDIIALL